jgi:hypothetical protein
MNDVLGITISILIYIGIMFITYWLRQIVKVLEDIKHKL